MKVDAGGIGFEFEVANLAILYFVHPIRLYFSIFLQGD